MRDRLVAAMLENGTITTSSIQETASQAEQTEFTGSGLSTHSPSLRFADASMIADAGFKDYVTVTTVLDTVASSEEEYSETSDSAGSGPA